MSGSAFKRSYGLSIASVLAIALMSYVLLDFHLRSLGHELLSSWLASSRAEIAQGNLLSSLSRHQSVLLASGYVKGGQLVDHSVLNAPSELMSFGEKLSVHLKPPVGADIETRSVGFLSVVSQVAVGLRGKRNASASESQSDIENEKSIQPLVFVISVSSRFVIGIYFVLLALGLISVVILDVVTRRQEAERVALVSRNRLELAELAAQVAHDIRSPIGALDAVRSLLPEKFQPLFNSALDRLKGIADDFQERSRAATAEASQHRKKMSRSDLVGSGPRSAMALDDASPFEVLFRSEPAAMRSADRLKVVFKTSQNVPNSEVQRQLVSVEEVAAAIKRLVEEKKSLPEASGLAIVCDVGSQPTHRAIGVECSQLALLRGVSNLIDNAIQAPAALNISVSIETQNGREMMIEVADDGDGFPEAIRFQLGQRGATFGKKSGSGLGLFSAVEFAQSASGHLEVLSRRPSHSNGAVRFQTIVRLLLPILPMDLNDPTA